MPYRDNKQQNFWANMREKTKKTYPKFKASVQIGLTVAFLYIVYSFFPFHMIPQSIAERGNGEKAAEKASDASQKVSQPVVVELFTSQGCYSCPPAEALLRQTAQRPDVLALEFHVDYWDGLVYGFSGKWKDQFSSPKATTRQADYNLSLRGKPNGYTPQIIVDGRLQMIGSRKSTIDMAIDTAKTQRQTVLTVTPTVIAPGDLNVALNTLDLPGTSQMLYVRFLKRKSTEVTSGENMGKTLTSYNIAREWHTINSWKGKSKTATQKIKPLQDNESCAVLIQDRKTREIYGAGLCQF